MPHLSSTLRLALPVLIALVSITANGAAFAAKPVVGRTPAEIATHRANCDVPHPPPICDPGEGDPPTDPTGVLTAVNLDRQDIFILTNRPPLVIPAMVRFSGRARDPDTDDPIKVRLTLNGALFKEVAANQGNHEFADSASWSPTVGSNSFCATAINVGAGQDAVIGCKTFQIDEPPLVASILSVARSGTTVSVRWQDQSNNEERIDVERYIIGGGYSTLASTRALNGAGTVTDTLEVTAAADDPRCYRMVVFSEYYRVYGTETCLPNTPPSPIRIGDLIPASNRMSIWFDSANNNAVSYRYERRPPSGTWDNAQLSPTSTAGTRLGATDVGLVPQTTYCYRIVATNRFGETAGPEACKTTTRSPLPIPTELRITSAAAYQINLSWTDNAADEGSYQVSYRRENSNSYAPVVSLPANPGTGPMSTSITNQIQPDTTYCFTVAAIADGADPNPGATICGKTEPSTSVSSFTGAPAAIQFCASVPVTLNWTVRAAANINLTRNNKKLFDRTNPNGLADWTDSFTDPSPFEGAPGDATYLLQANGPQGNPSTSFVVKAVSAFPILSVIAFVNNSYDSVQLQKANTLGTWDAVATVNAGTYYVIELEKCATAQYRAVDGRGTERWKSGIVLGYPTGPVWQPSIN